MAMARWDYFWIANVLYLGFVLWAVSDSVFKARRLPARRVAAMPGKPTRITNSIRALRFAHGEMTQAQLAERIGVTRQTIIAIEQSRYSPSLEMAFQIAQRVRRAAGRGLPVPERRRTRAERRPVPPAAVLLTGVYGTGKSSVAAELAFLLQERGERFALLDLDFLGWAATGQPGRQYGFRLMLANMRAVIANYAPGGRRLVRARLLRSRRRGTCRAPGPQSRVPLSVVRLEAPLAEIEPPARRRRHHRAPGRPAGRSGVDRGWRGHRLEDLLIRNDRPCPVVAREVLAFLGW